MYWTSAIIVLLASSHLVAAQKGYTYDKPQQPFPGGSSSRPGSQGFPSSSATPGYPSTAGGFGSSPSSGGAGGYGSGRPAAGAPSFGPTSRPQTSRPGGFQDEYQTGRPSTGFGTTGGSGFTAGPSTAGRPSSGGYPTAGAPSPRPTVGYPSSGSTGAGFAGGRPSGSGFQGPSGGAGFGATGGAGGSGFGSGGAGGSGFGSGGSGFGAGGSGGAGFGGGHGGFGGDVDEGDYSAIPGTPGQDYPILSEIPQTSFSCDQQAYPGYYADVETQCQVFHVCSNNKTYDFLCPNGTIFHQQYLVCVWWNQFDCNSAPQFFNVNEGIYDYSIKGSPQGGSSGFGPSGGFGGQGPSGPSTSFGGQQGPTGPSTSFGGQQGPTGPSTSFGGQQRPTGPSSGYSPASQRPSGFAPGTTGRPGFPQSPAFGGSSSFRPGGTKVEQDSQFKPGSGSRPHPDREYLPPY